MMEIAADVCDVISLIDDIPDIAIDNSAFNIYRWNDIDYEFLNEAFGTMVPVKNITLLNSG